MLVLSSSVACGPAVLDWGLTFLLGQVYSALHRPPARNWHRHVNQAALQPRWYLSSWAKAPRPADLSLRQRLQQLNRQVGRCLPHPFGSSAREWHVPATNALVLAHAGAVLLPLADWCLGITYIDCQMHSEIYEEEDGLLSLHEGFCWLLGYAAM